MSDEKDLEGLFDGDGSLELLIIHEELDKVEKLAGFLVLGVSGASLVHHVVLLKVNITVEIIIDFPDNHLDLSLGGLASEELENTGDIHVSDLVLFGLGLLGVLFDKVIENGVETSLEDGMDDDFLHVFSGALL